MQYMPVTDSMFLIAETRDQPMHVGGLQLFVPREGQTPDDLAEEMAEKFHVPSGDVSSMFLKRPATPAQIAGYTAWSYDDDIDMDYHVRRAILPRPGAIRDLLQYVSLNHGGLLDRRRPMWESHIIEGLADGRIAVYTKIHHSVVDGVTSLRLLQRCLSTDPDDRSGTAVWDERPKRRRRAEKDAQKQTEKAEPKAKGLLSSITGAVAQVVDVADQVVGLAPAAAKIAVAGVTDKDYVAPLKQAPSTILNVSIGSARRFAAQDWPIERLRAVGKAQGMTLNDVMVAMCSGALRTYLADQDALPDESLIAVQPVSLHSDGDSDGNSITAIAVRMATDLADPAERVAAIKASTDSAKAAVRGLRPLQALALGAAIVWPLAFTTIPGFVQYTPSGFNLMISSVPGPEEQLYWNGARLDGCYPVSIPLEGMALNITIATISGKANFGVTGARAELPSLQRILDHLETTLAELEALPPKA
ncbi:wax ester/triacylglycerol synthase family O-acyltransferase [Gordonia sp. HY285]|uniref:WS/DGAT/MGAT family O-acyltransferase n=1 Tax=Gordonia liuliyuniae TaxID=2911517 RepID=UPI001F4913D1|nr:wax ester/triacylglycerol synthase family O-acyltransferase [Gordonia liuliyuniae]MCF8608707.1 wax ester/triacylglycerol synthase family O-acyltransferase [Gordonia liuliyuniae]